MAGKGPTKTRGKAAKPVKPIFQLNLDMGMGLDFDPDDFDLVSGKADKADKPVRGQKQRDVRILRPRLDMDGLTQTIAFENAQAFARQIDLTPGARTFAWVSGNFIFGDLIEALVTSRRVGIRRLYCCSLSFGQDNVDSLKNVMLLMGNELERLVLVLSGWMYSKHKYDLVPYMYQELDDPAGRVQIAFGRVQIAFGRWHAKLILIETVTGHTISIHGSANLSSNSSIEQLMVEIDNRELHDFNVAILERIAAQFGTINQGASYEKLKPVPGREAWEVLAGKEI